MMETTMAKRPSKTTTPTPESDVAEATETVEVALTAIEFPGFGSPVGDVSPKGLAYLIRYGLTQSMQDCIAGMVKELKGDGKTDDEIADAIKVKQTERWNAILAGTMTTGGARGPRLKGIESVIFDVAVERLKVAYAAKNFTWPKKAAEVKTAVDKYLAKHAESAREEAHRRIAETTADVIDLDDL